MGRVRDGQGHRWMGAEHGAGTAMHGLGQQVSRTLEHVHLPSSWTIPHPKAGPINTDTLEWGFHLAGSQLVKTLLSLGE